MRIGPLEDLDVARYDAFLDRHEGEFKALRALLEGAPTSKALRKALAALRAWPEGSDRDTIVIPYAAHWLRRWRATLAINAQDFPGFWDDLCTPERVGLLGLIDQLTIDQTRDTSAWTNARLERLVQPARLTRLETLTLIRCATLRETKLLDALLSAQALPSLHTLRLQGCPLQGHDLRRLSAGATTCPVPLRELHITHAELTREMLEPLLEHPVMAQVEALGLTYCELTDDTILALTRSPMLGQLRALHLEGNTHLTSVAGEALDDAHETLPHLSQPRLAWDRGKALTWVSYLGG